MNVWLAGWLTLFCQSRVIMTVEGHSFLFSHFLRQLKVPKTSREVNC
jgi:hypothetical protein